MSEATAEATATEAEQTSTEEQQPKPSETVDFWKQKAREQEKRAKENAEAAKRLAEYEEAQKSETQKISDRLAAAEERATKAEAKALSLTIATENKLGPEDAALIASLPDEDSMRALATRLAGQAEEQRKNGNHVPNEGTATRPADNGEGAFARSLFSAGDQT